MMMPLLDDQMETKTCIPSNTMCNSYSFNGYFVLQYDGKEREREGTTLAQRAMTRCLAAEENTQLLDVTCSKAIIFNLGMIAIGI